MHIDDKRCHWQLNLDYICLGCRICLRLRFFCGKCYAFHFLTCFLCCPSMCFYVLSSAMSITISTKNDVRFVFTSSCLYDVSCLISYLSFVCVCLTHIVLFLCFCFLRIVHHVLLTLPEHLSSPPVFSLTRSLALCVCFVDRCLSFCAFSFGHCVVCSSSICGFWLPLWYLQTLPTSFSGLSILIAPSVFSNFYL